MNSELRYQPPTAEVADIPRSAASAGPLNPWFSMWLQPRVTIQQIVESDPNRLVIVLSMLIGIVQVLDRATSQSMGDRVPFGIILAIAFVLGPIMGVIAVHLYALLLRWTGRLLGGEASSQNIRAALVWGNVPGLWTSLSWIPALLVVKHEVFTTETPLVESSPTHLAVFLGFGLIQLVGGVWTIVSVCQALGQVQAFSAWKALGNAFLAAFVLVTPVLIIAFAVATSR